MAKVMRDLDGIFDEMPTLEDLPSKFTATKGYALW